MNWNVTLNKVVAIVNGWKEPSSSSHAHDVELLMRAESVDYILWHKGLQAKVGRAGSALFLIFKDH